MEVWELVTIGVRFAAAAASSSAGGSTRPCAGQADPGGSGVDDGGGHLAVGGVAEGLSLDVGDGESALRVVDGVHDMGMLVGGGAPQVTGLDQRTVMHGAGVAQRQWRHGFAVQDHGGVGEGEHEGSFRGVEGSHPR